MSFKNASTIDQQVRAKVMKGVGKAIDAKVTEDYAKELKDRVVKRTRLGIGVDIDSGASKRLKKLSKNYKKSRKGQPRLSSDTTAARSNLTATGQLLDFLTAAKVKIGRKIGIKIIVVDKRGPDLFGNGPTIGNKALVDALADGGRTFLGFTNSQKNAIKREIRQFILKFLR